MRKMISAAIKLASLFAILLVALQATPASSSTSPNQRQHNLPGHYEFELAPKMEPPSVRKPPYQQSGQLCAGSDPFAGFSPRDTLCGDLNQGRVPVNPLGQSIADQSYPFELIKNKTLQFLARALPVLKLEYETIPKVARFVQQPSQHLLNPTHQQSLLGAEQLVGLNQRLAAFNGLSRDELAALQTPYQLSAGGFLRRRRKRSPRAAGGLGTGTVLALAELLPNASLVISSAHSGRLLEPKGRHSVSPALSVVMPPAGALNETGSQRAVSPLGVITKDGYKSLPGAAAAAAGAKGAQRALGQASPAAQPANNRPAEQTNKQTSGKPAHQQQAAAAAAGIGRRENFSATNNDNHATKSALKSPQSAAELDLDTGASGVPASFVAPPPPPPEALGQARSAGLPATSSQAPANGPHRDQQRPDGLAKRTSARLPCSEAANGFTSAVCQAAAALIEGDRLPGWLQLAKHLGNAYAGSSDNLASAGNPVWSILASLAQEGTAKNGGQLAQTKSNFLNLLGPVSSLLTGSGAPAGQPAASKSAEQPAEQASSAQQQSSRNQLSSLAGSTLTRLALAGWASNAIASLVEYFAPSVFQSISGRGFAKRKKPYDPQETFVDTPASLAAAASVAGRSANLLTNAITKQPPTPCPSVEEYISPTFARNYQGAWKYVVQIPHEGYFTQTIQRTSCVRQKCEFTDGVCHESPRWVSLLVAEIYYPNAVYATNSNPLEQQATASSNNNLAYAQNQALLQQAHQQQQQQLPKAAGSDPLQMTDSLANYNLNLNSAFVNAAHELGLDPSNVANMQQLANAYNYQISQRYGNLNAASGAQQQQSAESRASFAFAQPNGNGNAITPGQYQPQANLYQPASASTGQQPNYNEYITALAAEALRQNPSMSVNDLINSLQLSRKKRDLASGQQRRVGQSAASAQSRSGVESVQSLNELLPTSNNQQMSPFKPSTHSGDAQPHQTSGQPSNGNAPPSLPAHDQQQQQQQQQQHGQPETGDQMECDGHDKIGCYVVRVYYDWFLVNGSCKCWKTSAGSGSGSSSSSSSGNSFLRRIFTG